MHAIITHVLSNATAYIELLNPLVGAMSTGDDLGHRWGRNGEFCVAVGPVTRTASILASSVKGAY